jgi:N-hydroxyarylamine O-acetyltransferase
MAQEIDVSAYFYRIGYQGPYEATLAVLTDLHRRHPAKIAFEGLDPFLGRPVAIDPLSIQAKLVLGQRGGHCHEQNALFFHVLSALGFNAVPLAARVVWMSPGRTPALTHRLTMVRFTGRRFPG